MKQYVTSATTTFIWNDPTYSELQQRLECNQLTPKPFDILNVISVELKLIIYKLSSKFKKLNTRRKKIALSNIDNITLISPPVIIAFLKTATYLRYEIIVVKSGRDGGCDE